MLYLYNIILSLLRFSSVPQLTCMILGVLHFDSTGPPYFIFNEDGSLTWPQGARITDVLLGSTLEAYNNQSLTLTGQNNQQVYITQLFVELP